MNKLLNSFVSRADGEDVRQKWGWQGSDVDRMEGQGVLEGGSILRSLPKPLNRVGIRDDSEGVCQRRG